jgi:hypothetical protein
MLTLLRWNVKTGQGSLPSRFGVKRLEDVLQNKSTKSEKRGGNEDRNLNKALNEDRGRRVRVRSLESFD